MPELDGFQVDPGDSGAGADRGWPFARHCLDGAVAERRPRALPGGRHGRLPGQADPGRRPVGGDRPGRRCRARRPTVRTRPARPARAAGRLRGRRRHPGEDLSGVPGWPAGSFDGRSGCPGERDAVRLREAAHKLCGMVAAFSTVAGGVASDLEDHAAQGQLEEARPLVEQLETIARELYPARWNRPVRSRRCRTGRGCRRPRPDSQPVDSSLATVTISLLMAVRSDTGWDGSSRDRDSLARVDSLDLLAKCHLSKSV